MDSQSPLSRPECPTPEGYLWHRSEDPGRSHSVEAASGLATNSFHSTSPPLPTWRFHRKNKRGTCASVICACENLAGGRLSGSHDVFARQSSIDPVMVR